MITIKIGVKFVSGGKSDETEVTLTEDDIYRLAEEKVKADYYCDKEPEGIYHEIISS